jgi:cytochrome c oxidase cbb3-type subunit III
VTRGVAFLVVISDMRISRWLVAIAVILTACKRETRVFEEPLSFAQARSRYQVSVQPRGGREMARVTNWYEQNAYSLALGQQLYMRFNCVGCHAQGGGGIGPALIDATWIYGSDPPEVYGSIMYGRSNGMPAFRGRIREEEAWQLAAYVRSIAGLTPKSAVPGRRDAIKAMLPPATSAQQTPSNATKSGP